MFLYDFQEQQTWRFLRKPKNFFLPEIFNVQRGNADDGCLLLADAMGKKQVIIDNQKKQAEDIKNQNAKVKTKKSKKKFLWFWRACFKNLIKYIVVMFIFFFFKISNKIAQTMTENS